MNCAGCGWDMPGGTKTFRKVMAFKPSKGSGGIKIVKTADGEYCRGCVEAMTGGSGVVWEQPTLF